MNSRISRKPPRLINHCVCAGQETLVWCVAITDDFVIISGDSRGLTSFWDGKLGTVIDQVNAHKADVLCLCLSEDQKTLYSAGMKPLIISQR